MGIRHLSSESWQEELDSFSRRHEGWIVSINTRKAHGGVAVEARDVPLEGVSVASSDATDVSIAVGGARGHFTHQVRNVAAVDLDLTDGRAERAMLIRSKDGTVTTVQFRSPMRAEEVDGVPVVDRR